MNYICDVNWKYKSEFLVEMGSLFNRHFGFWLDIFTLDCVYFWGNLRSYINLIYFHMEMLSWYEILTLPV